jgi:hypothetical protein
MKQKQFLGIKCALVSLAHIPFTEKVKQTKYVTMIDLATSWFEIHQYDNKRAITVANIAEEE